MNSENLYENLQQAVRQALQEGNLEEVLDILSNELRQARLYLTMDTGEEPRSGLRLGGWQVVDHQAQDLIMSDIRLRLWLGDQYDRTYSQPTLSSGDFNRQSPEDGHSISLGECTTIPSQDILDLLAHTPATPSPPPATTTTTTTCYTRPPDGPYPTWLPPPPSLFHEPTREELDRAGEYIEQCVVTLIMGTVILWCIIHLL